MLAYLTAIVEPLARNDWLTLVVAALVSVAAVDVFVRTSGPARKAGRPLQVDAVGADVPFAMTMTGAVGKISPEARA